MKTTLAVIGVAMVSAWTAPPVLADQPQTDPKAVVTDKPDPTLTPRDLTEREQEYLSALKKCEPLAEAERRKCAASVKSRHGVM